VHRDHVQSVGILALAAGLLVSPASARMADPSGPVDSFGIGGRVASPAPAAPAADPGRPAADQAGNEPGGGGVADIGVQTIGFEPLAHDDALVASHGDMYVEEGWIVQQEGGQPWDLATFGTQEARYPGSTALFNQNAGGMTYLYPVHGAFTLVSLDVSNLNANGPTTVTFTGHREDGSTVTRTCTTSYEGSALETFYFSGFNNLWYVEWEQESPFHQFDNIRVTRAPVTMDFQSLTHDNAESNIVGSEYYEDGFVLTQGANEPHPLSTYGLQHPKYPGSTALYNNTPDGSITLTDYLGGTFNIHSIDLSNLNNNGPTMVTFTGTRENNGTIQQTFKTQPGLNALETFQFDGFIGLTSLTWTQADPYHQFDNLVLSRGRTVMDFTKLSKNDNGSHAWGKTYREDGFTLETDSSHGYYTFGTQESRWPGSTALFDNIANGNTTLRAIDGSPFGAVSIALATLNGAEAQEITFTGVKPNGDVVEQKAQVSGNGHRLETVMFDPKFRRLKSLHWSQKSPYHQFDAITLVPTTTRLIDFQALEHDGAGSVNAGKVYDEDGFRISKGQGEAFDFAAYGTAANSYPGSTALFNNTPSGLTRLATVSGNDFDLLQMDISRLGNGGADVKVDFAGRKTDGSFVHQSFIAYGDAVGLQTVHFTGFDSLQWVEWQQESPYHQFDNIAVVEAVPVVDCYADFDGNGVLDLFDFLAYVNAFNAADAKANCDGNGSLDLFDFLCYVNAFNAGC
jgi:hypothetical protein